MAEYLAGRTPNPCNACNRYVKWEALLQRSLEIGADFIATGHYAVINRQGDRYLLERAADTSKDQTYVLYCLSQDQLAHSLFPLGELTKSEVREIATELGFVNADKTDSQDICFVPDGDYSGFITSHTGKTYPAGDYVDIYGNILGKHKGIINYTIGQRKGLGIALGKPQFVINKDAVSGRVILGDEEHLFYNKVEVEDVNFIPFDNLNSPLNVTAKLRYGTREDKAIIHPTEKGVIVEFEKPQRAPSSGQSAVFYDGNTVIGGGKIVGGIK